MLRWLMGKWMRKKPTQRELSDKAMNLKGGTRPFSTTSYRMVRGTGGKTKMEWNR